MGEVVSIVGVQNPTLEVHKLMCSMGELVFFFF